MQELTNNEKFNQLLNSCANPRAIYNALLEFAPFLKEMVQSEGDAA